MKPLANATVKNHNATSSRTIGLALMLFVYDEKKKKKKL